MPVAEQYEVVGVEDPQTSAATSTPGGFEVVGEEDPTQEATAAPKAPVTMGQRRGGTVSESLSPANQFTADPNEDSAEVRLGKMVPQGAVPALQTAKKVLVDPFEKAAGYGKAAGEAVADFGQPDTSGAPPWIQKTAAIERGVSRGVLGTAGAMVTDPRNWPFLASGAARPILQKIISLGFTGMMGKNSLDAAQELHDNWDKMTPAQRAQAATSAGISGLMAVGGVTNAIQPRLGVAISPEEVRVGVGANPLDTGPIGATVSFPRGGYKPQPPSAPAIEPPTIEGNAQPAPAPEPVAPPNPEVQAAVVSMAKANQTEVMAQRVVRGLPPVPPPPPTPAPAPAPPVTAEAIQQVGQQIESLPKEQQAQAIVAAHGELAKGFLEQGKVVTPDGQIHIVKTPDQADSLAAKVVNDEVSRQNKVAEKAPEPAVNMQSAEAMGAGRKAAEQVAKASGFEVVGEEEPKAKTDIYNPPAATDEPRSAEDLATRAFLSSEGAKDIGAEARKETERRIGPVPRNGQPERRVAESGFEVVGEEPAKQAFAKDDQVQISGVETPATVRHMSDSGGLKVMRVEFAEPTKVPWSTNPVTKTSVPVKYQDKVQAYKEKEPAKPKSEWQQLYEKALSAQPERESELRKMSGEQLRGEIGKATVTEPKPVPERLELTPEKQERHESAFAQAKAELPKGTLSEQLKRADEIERASRPKAASAKPAPKEDVEAIKARIAELEAKKGATPEKPKNRFDELRAEEGKRIAERFRKVADGMDKQIDDKRREMTQNPTPKRMAEYRTRIIDADEMERTQKAFRALADAHESGKVPPELIGLRTKDEIATLVHKGLDSSKGGYYDRIPRQDYYDKSPAGKKLQEMIEKRSNETSEEKAAKLKASEISQLEAKVQFQKLPGYFPTPKAVISRLLDVAFIEPGMKVLEPSAGKGDIAEAIRQEYPDAKLDVVEQQSTLRKILELKGFNVVDEDFLEHKGEYDRIVMNPPFEKGADVDHVRHAFELLKPGGRLVAVMSPHAEFASDKKSVEFRNWMDEFNSQTEKLAASSFKESGTGVASRRVVIDKPKTEPAKDYYSTPAWQMSRNEYIKDVREGRDFKQLGVNPTPLATLRGAKDFESLDRQAANKHNAEVTMAVAEKKAVPAEVLKDYPELQKVSGGGAEVKTEAAGETKEPTLKERDWARANEYKQPEGGQLAVKPVPASFWTEEKPVYSLLNVRDGTRGGTATGNWDEIVARADKENLRMGEAERDRLARIDKERAPGTQAYEDLRKQVAAKEAAISPSDDQKLFNQGANEELDRFGKETNDYGKVAAGVAKVLEAKGVKALPKYVEQSDRMAATYGKSRTPLSIELSDNFHDPLAMLNQRTPLDDITRAMEAKMYKAPLKVDAGGWMYKQAFDMGHSSEYMQRELETGKLADELRKVEAAPAVMRHEAEIVRALRGDTEAVKKVEGIAAETERNASDFRQKAEQAIARQKEVEADKEKELAQRPFTLAKEIRPVEESRWTVKQAWAGNVIKEGEQTPWVSDGHSAINTALASKKFTNKNMAGESRLGKFSSGDRRYITSKQLDGVLASGKKGAKYKATVLGAITADKLAADGKFDTAYIENVDPSKPKAVSALIPVNAKILRMVQDVVAPDEIRAGGEGDAVAFYKQGEMAAVIMPLRKQQPIDLATAKRVMAGDMPKAAEPTEEGPSLKELATSESGFFEPAKVGEAFTKSYNAEIKPALDKAGLTLGKSLSELQHLIAPRSGVPIKTLDSAMRLTGVREQHRFIIEQTLQKAQALFDKMPRDGQVSFVDNYKQGEKQATPELQQIAEFMGKTDDATYRSVVEAQVGNLNPKTQNLWKAMTDGEKTSFLRKIQDFKADEDLPAGPLKDLASHLLNFKEDHFRVLWKVVPGKAEAKGAAGIRGIRPLEGSKGFLKQSTLATMSEGLERGGEPVDYNPVRMFQLAQADSWRYITAQRMWQDALADGGRVLVKQGSQIPEGFKFVEDKIGNVRFPASSGEGMVQAGRWALREDWHRLLSNMLSHDYIRESTIGNGLMAMKNQLTGYRLSLSPFHALTTTVSSWANAVGRGLQNVNYAARNQSLSSLVEGAKDIATFPVAPIMDYRLGTSVVRYAASPEEFLRTQRGMDFIKRYPEAAQLVDDLFAAGAKLSLHEDERLRSIEGLRQAIAENRYIAALLKSPFALNQQVMRPLFGYYIPRIKLATFLKDHSFELNDRAADLSDGIKTRGEVARKTWDTTENIYGQMNWDARWWNRTLKSSIQFAFRAFTWFSGNVRLVKDAGLGQTREAWQSAKWWNEKMGGDAEPLPSSGPIPRIDPAFAKILGLASVYMAANAALQYAMTREAPKDAKDLFSARIGGVDANGKPLRVVAPAIVIKDAMSLWGHGPWGYLRSKESDLISGISDVVANEDFRHAMIHNPEDKWWKQRYDDAAHVLGSPIGISNYQREHQYGESKAKAVLGAVGFSPAPGWISQTPLEKKITQLQLADPGSAMTPETRALIDLKHSIVGALRNHDDGPLRQAVADKKITYKESVALRHRSRDNPLEDRIKGLSFMKNDREGYSQLWQLSQTKGITPEEKRIVDRMLSKKRGAMFSKGEGEQVHAVEAAY